jgi:hydrogenase maturation factor
MARSWPPRGRRICASGHRRQAGAPGHEPGSDCGTGALRLLGLPGDILLVISAGDHAGAVDLLSRAEAWGLTRIWLGAGPRPTGVQAEHIVWRQDIDPHLAAYSGDLVLLYHLLWELTHVVFEHPGLLSPEPAACTEDVCITCSDEGKVAEVRVVGDLGQVDVVVGGVLQQIDASLVDPVVPGDLLLVHAGVAITTLSRERP